MNYMVIGCIKIKKKLDCHSEEKDFISSWNLCAMSNETLNQDPRIFRLSLNLKSNDNLTLFLNQLQHSRKEQKQGCNILSKHEGFSYCMGWISIAAPVKGSKQTRLSVDEITPTLSLSAWHKERVRNTIPGTLKINLGIC